MVRSLLLILAVIAVAGCHALTALPGGYTVSHGDRGKAWLQNPDGTIAYDGLIKRLHYDESKILIVAYPVSYGGKVVAPYPLDGSCYVALVIDGSTRSTKQIHLAEADRLSARMSEVVSYKRPCLKGMPNTPG